MNVIVKSGNLISPLVCTEILKLWAGKIFVFAFKMFKFLKSNKISISAFCKKRKKNAENGEKVHAAEAHQSGWRMKF